MQDQYRIFVILTIHIFLFLVADYSDRQLLFTRDNRYCTQVLWAWLILLSQFASRVKQKTSSMSFPHRSPIYFERCSCMKTRTKIESADRNVRTASPRKMLVILNLLQFNRPSYSVISAGNEDLFVFAMFEIWLYSVFWLEWNTLDVQWSAFDWILTKNLFHRF